MTDRDAGGGAESELVEGFRRGDPAVFQELVVQYEPFLRRLVARYTKSQEEAKDIAQLCFLRAFEHRASFRGESSLRTWLYRIAVNLALNHVRRGPRDISIALAGVAPFTTGLETTRLVAAEVWRKVARHLEVLPPKQRLALELRLFHELSFEEIGVLAECSEDSAKQNYHHALRAIRAVLPSPG